MCLFNIKWTFLPPCRFTSAIAQFSRQNHWIRVPTGCDLAFFFKGEDAALSSFFSSLNFYGSVVVWPLRNGSGETGKRILGGPGDVHTHQRHGHTPTHGKRGHLKANGNGIGNRDTSAAAAAASCRVDRSWSVCLSEVEKYGRHSVMGGQ